MKRIVATLTVAVLLSGCAYVTQYASDEEAQATWNCISHGSWEIITEPENHSYSTGLFLVITNQMSVPILFDMIPWWGTWAEGHAAGDTTIYAPAPPPNFVAPGDSVGALIEEPFFFRDGALFTFWRQSPRKNPNDPDAVQFDVYEFRRLTGDEVPSQPWECRIVPVRDKKEGQHQPESYFRKSNTTPEKD